MRSVGAPTVINTESLIFRMDTTYWHCDVSGQTAQRHPSAAATSYPTHCFRDGRNMLPPLFWDTQHVAISQ